MKVIKTISVTVETANLIPKLKLSGINISKICEDAIIKEAKKKIK